MSDYETPAAEVWSGSTDNTTWGTGGVSLPDLPLT